MEEKFSEMLDNEETDKLVDFFMGLNQTQRHALIPILLERSNKCLKAAPARTRRAYVGTFAQLLMLTTSGYFCLDVESYHKYKEIFINLNREVYKIFKYQLGSNLPKIELGNIFELYIPPWISEFVNDRELNIDLKLYSYEELLYGEEKGTVTLSPQLVVAALVDVPYEHQDTSDVYRITLDLLYKYPVTLEKHIWFFFYYNSDISTRSSLGLNYDENWTQIFCLLVGQKKIDRMRVFRECLLATKRDFAPSSLSWFNNLFNSLVPQHRELMELQSELLVAACSIDPRSAIAALTILEELCTEPEFKAKEFFMNIPLIHKNKKSIETMMNAIIDKCMRSKPEQIHTLCEALCNGFVSNDLTIPASVAKFIKKYTNL